MWERSDNAIWAYGWTCTLKTPAALQAKHVNFLHCVGGQGHKKDKMTGQGPKRAVVKIHAKCNTSWLKKTSMWGRSKRRRIDRPTLKHTASEELVSACLNKWDILYRLLDRDSRFSEDKPSFKKSRLRQENTVSIRDPQLFTKTHSNVSFSGSVNSKPDCTFKVSFKLL